MKHETWWTWTLIILANFDESGITLTCQMLYAIKHYLVVNIDMCGSFLLILWFRLHGKTNIFFLFSVFLLWIHEGCLLGNTTDLQWTLEENSHTQVTITACFVLLYIVKNTMFTLLSAVTFPCKYVTNFVLNFCMLVLNADQLLRLLGCNVVQTCLFKVWLIYYTIRFFKQMWKEIN